MIKRVHPLSWLAKAFEPSPLLGSAAAITIGLVLMVNLIGYTFTGEDSPLHLGPDRLKSFVVLGNIPTFVLALFGMTRKKENAGVEVSMLLLAAGMYWGGLMLVYLNEQGAWNTFAVMVFLSPYFLVWMIYGTVFIGRGKGSDLAIMGMLFQVAAVLGGGTYFLFGIMLLTAVSYGHPLLDLLYFLPWVIGGICYGGIFGLMAPGYVPLALRELWGRWTKDRDHTIRMRLAEEGYATLLQLRAVCSGSEKTVRAALDGVGCTEFEGDDPLFWRNDHLKERQTILQGMVEARGRVHLREAERALDVPTELVKHVVHRLSESDAFTGWVDWDNGMLVSAESAELGAMDTCPRCAGELRHQGRGVVACFHCGSEIFVRRDAA